jgi:methyl-accepting chemotaxis protein
VGQLSQTTQQNASSSEQLAATAEEMSSQAEQLQTTMSFFKRASGPAMQSKVRRAASSTASKRMATGSGRAMPAATEVDESRFTRF